MSPEGKYLKINSSSQGQTPNWNYCSSCLMAKQMSLCIYPSVVQFLISVLHQIDKVGYQKLVWKVLKIMVVLVKAGEFSEQNSCGSTQAESNHFSDSQVTE